MPENLPEVGVKPKKSSPKSLIYFLIFPCFIFASFIIYANYSFKSSQKGSSSMVTKESQTQIRIADSCGRLLAVLSVKLGFFKNGIGDKEIENLATKNESIGDVNSDGKVNSSDFTLVLTKGKDEKWCQEILDSGSSKD